jgi:flagellar biogenesis protein FliO
MKTPRLERSVVTESTPRICAQSSARLQACSGTPQLTDFSGEASVISLQNVKELCSGAWLKARKQLARAWRNALSLLSQARANASAWSSRASKTSYALISHACATSIKQSSCAWKRLRAQQIARSKSKRLQVAETVSLGEKRFVAVIKVDGQEFLIGGGATNVALLAQLGASEQMGLKNQLNARTSFDEILTEKMTVPEKQPAKRAKKKAAKFPVGKIEEQL